MAKVTNLYAKVEYPDNGHDDDVETVSHLDKSKFYKVTELDMGQSSTEFKIEGNSYCFNSVNFEFYNESKKPIDIFSMPEYNPYLNINRRKNK